MVKGDFFQGYSRKHVHFYNEEVPVLLRSGLVLARKSAGKPRIVDLGCGDGRLIFALCKNGLLQDVSELYGVDVSEKRIERVTKELPFVKCVISDAIRVKELQRSSFDLVICSQLIEHVENDHKLLHEMRRLLRNNGLVYVSSVIKSAHAMYFYFMNGSFRLDPTHFREYASVAEFLSLLESEGFHIIGLKTCQIVFPLMDLIMRLFVKIGFLSPNVRFYQQYSVLGKIRALQIPVIGYKNIEVLARKTK
jgi:2-polyprenyl-3-methyl-5-hydroxy-6-metoxy-1,4-benzoquinol methylase